jgi:hypothetical protein
MRIVQVACGVATIGVAAWLAWKVQANAAIASLLRFLVAGAPFHVLYSRVARPYAITTLLAVLALAALWRWKARRTWPLAGPRFAPWPRSPSWLAPALRAVVRWSGLLFLMAAIVGAAATERAKALRSSALLAVRRGRVHRGAARAPALTTSSTLSAKAGNSRPDPKRSFAWASLFTGGLPDPLTLGSCSWPPMAPGASARAIATGRYLLFVALGPILV